MILPQTLHLIPLLPSSPLRLAGVAFHVPVTETLRPAVALRRRAEVQLELARAGDAAGRGVGCEPAGQYADHVPGEEDGPEMKNQEACEVTWTTWRTGFGGDDS